MGRFEKLFAYVAYVENKTQGGLFTYTIRYIYSIFSFSFFNSYLYYMLFNFYFFYMILVLVYNKVNVITIDIRTVIVSNTAIIPAVITTIIIIFINITSMS